MTRVHVIGAGLSGLSCAVRLRQAGRDVSLYDQAGHAGGRCRSFHDDVLDRVIDNGNHLLLSGNTDALSYLEAVGAPDGLTGAAEPVFPFVDLESGKRWTVRLSPGRWPGWIFRAGDRVPDTTPGDYLRTLWRLLRSGPAATVADCFDPAEPLVARFWEPLAVAALNTEIEQAAAVLLKPVIVETFGRGGQACRPLVAREGLSACFVDPALTWLAERGTATQFRKRLRGLALDDRRATAIGFTDGEVALDSGDAIVLAVPPTIAATLLPGLSVPQDSRAIVNAHFRVAASPELLAGSPLLGVLGGLAQWIFLRGDIVSVTVSAADAAAELPAETLTARLWAEVAAALRLPPESAAPCRIVKEKRATFAQTPAEVARRPQARTRWANLFLAGDWTDTGLPATIEGSIRSGRLAAEALLGREINR
jgi:squalene-associated FAD-dependent desaturase